jgi:small-conductance mechanosensitive channel
MMVDLEFIWQGNSLRDWSTALGLALSINLFVGVLKWLIEHRLAKAARKTYRKMDDVIVAMARHTKQLLVFGVTLLAGTRYLDLPVGIDHVLIKVATISGFLQLGLWLSGALNFWIEHYRRQSMSRDLAAATSLAAISFVGRVLLWTFLVLFMLDNLGVNVTAMVAGLGVGGIAVALAMQNILGDLFASLSIVIDKPFVIGDVITVDSFTGSVEHVGLKTTRLRSSTGEQIIISNSDLLKTRIRNFKRMTERRMLFNFGVVYETSPAQLAAIPALLRDIVATVPQARFERAHFKAFGLSALEFEVVYWMTNPDFQLSMDAQQQVNLALLERLQEAGIELAQSTPPAAAGLKPAHR